jgi:hypothetical protein
MNEGPVAVTILEQRRIEAAILKPVFDSLAARLGTDTAREILNEVIDAQAFAKGRALRQTWPEGTLTAFAQVWDVFAEGGALDVAFLERRPDRLHLKVTRCRYAEHYAEAGYGTLGFTISCRRDEALVRGYSDSIRFERRSTIQEGAPCCEFIFTEGPQ